MAAPGPSARDRYLALFTDTRPSERLQLFSDAVFAIAMTLLVLDIDLPAVDRDEVGAALVDLAPQFFAYALSFVLIATTWMEHHRRYSIIETVDSRLIRLNLSLLFVVAFVPFPTSVLSEYGATTPSVVLYAATITAMGLVQLATWVHVCRRGLRSTPIDRGAYRFGLLSHLVEPVVMGVSIVIALLGWPLVALFTWLLVIPGNSLVMRLTVTRRQDLRPLT